MVSGNFLVGDCLSFEGFEEYVLPILKDKRYLVQDRLIVLYENHKKSILVSVVGRGDLEKSINDSLVESGIVIEEEAKIKQPHGISQNPIAWRHEVSEFSHVEKKKGKKDVSIFKGKYTTIGIYTADNTASELFPSIAQGYLLRDLEVKSEEVVNEIRRLLGKKLSDLS